MVVSLRRRQAVYGGHSENSIVPPFAIKSILGMHVPNTARRSVIFIGEMIDGDVFRPRATGFFVGVPSGKIRGMLTYLVTAEHVITGLAEKQKPIYCRVNRKDGRAAVEPLNPPQWWHHPEAERDPTDVVIAAVHANWDLLDHEPIPMPEHKGLNPGILARRDIGLGDETFTIGLFRHHAGTERNIPIIRIGNIAALPEEPVRTRWGYMKAHLIEMRSIAGLSGSPVFIDIPGTQPPQGAVFGVPDPRYMPDPEQVNWFQYRLLGLVSSHFEIPELKEDSVVEDDKEGTEGINTGIAVVVPEQKIIETLYQPDLKTERAKLEEQHMRQAAVLDTGAAIGPGPSSEP